jgi:hypothetical protein
MVKCCSSHEEECRFPTKTQCRMMTQILVPGCKFPRIQHAISQNLNFLIICQHLQTYNNTILVGNANFFWSHLTGCNLVQNLVYEIKCLCYPPLSRYDGSQKCCFPIRNDFCASVFSFPQCYIRSPSSARKNHAVKTDPSGGKCLQVRDMNMSTEILFKITYNWSQPKKNPEMTPHIIYSYEYFKSFDNIKVTK